MNEKTFSIHSKYNPQKEAERFVESIAGIPDFIIVSEPGKSYIEEHLRKKFKNAKLLAIRYTDSLFLESDKLWDHVWRPSNGNLLFFLMNQIPDEYLARSKFLAWEPSNRAWPEQANYVWKTIKQTIKTIQSIMYTRKVFGPKWLKNILKNTVFSKNIVSLTIPKTDFILTAAGPSLNSFLQFKNCNRPILTVSSALKALKFYNITPDICISTDGGFWANNHFRDINKNTPILFPLESAITSYALNNNPLSFLNYGSKLEKTIFANLNIPTLVAKRNGTVTGTALELLLEYTNNNVFITGLDLCSTNGFSHVRPHESSNNIQNTSNILNPLTTGLAKTNFDSRSLETYATWFLGLKTKETQRIFRLGFSGYNLPNIKRISFEELNKQTEQKNSKIAITPISIQNYKEKKCVIINILEKVKKNILSSNFDFFLNTDSIEKDIVELLAYTDFINFLNTQDKKNNLEILKLKIKNKLDTVIEGFLE